MHQTQEGIAQQVAGTGSTRVFAVTVAADGTVWAGGDSGATLYQVSADTISVQQVVSLLEDPQGRVEDLAFDQLGRLHAVVFSAQRSGHIVWDAGEPCQTMNAVEPTYPFQVLDIETGSLQPSPSTRVTAADNGTGQSEEQRGVDGTKNGAAARSLKRLNLLDNI